MRVLVVEDQDDLREVVVETLREESFAVDESADGEEGLYKACLLYTSPSPRDS